MVRQIGGLSRQLLCVVALVVAAGCNDGAGSSSPSISGTPETQAQVGLAYSFTPTVSDPGRAAIGFGIGNKPSWTSFNVATGQLSGTPSSSDLGTYPDILITASWGTARASLRSFTITVASGSTDPVASGSTDPLNLPLAISSSPIFTFLGSFTVPTTIVYGGSGLSVSGSTLYLSGLFEDPNGSGNYLAGGGEAAISIPTLTGTPAYDGSNGAATVIAAPTRPGSYVAPANYTLTAVPSTGATSATFTTLPTGFAANAGWYVMFTGSDTEDQPITALSGDTFSWPTGLAGNSYSSAVSVYQWNPSYPWGAASGDRITGSLVYNGSLYITGGAYYDGDCNEDLGWILSANTNITGWGSVNTVSGQPTEYSRRYAGQLGVVPPIWQPYLGGPLFVAAAPGSLSIIGCEVPIGFSFSTFDPTDVSSGGGAVPVTPHVDYFYQGVLTSAWPQELSARSFTGPFPLTGGTYYPATLSSAPTTGATTASFALPSGTVTATANILSGSNSLVITSINSGTISNSGIYYTVSGPGISSENIINPAIDAGPGNATSTGTYQLETPALATTNGISITLIPQGYSAQYYTITFSDGETRVVHLTNGEATIPYPTSGTNDPSTFAALTGGGFTTSVTVAPMGDNYVSSYSLPLGTAFIEPGSRSLLFVSIHEYGPGGIRGDLCAPGASGTNEIPLNPDTNYYVQMQVTAYDLQSVLNASNIYSVSPYAAWPFPGESTFHTTRPPNCLSAFSSGWAAYDPIGGKLYAILLNNANAPGNGEMIVNEWSVAPL